MGAASAGGGGLLDARDAISMDGLGHALDNMFVERLWQSVKNDDVSLNGYANRRSAPRTEPRPLIRSIYRAV
jgi:hypothetical protein